MALSDLIEFRVEFGLGSLPGTGVYGTSLYGTGTYGASGEGSIQWTDFTQLCHSLTTKTGKNLSQPLLKRFRTGTAIFSMDNTTGAFVPGSPTIPGFLQLRPGRHARILARPSWYSQECDPLPPNTTWQGVTGRTWTSHGDLMKLPTGCGYPFPIPAGTTWQGVTGRTWQAHPTGSKQFDFTFQDVSGNPQYATTGAGTVAPAGRFNDGEISVFGSFGENYCVLHTASNTPFTEYPTTLPFNVHGFGMFNLTWNGTNSRYEATVTGWRPFLEVTMSATVVIGSGPTHTGLFLDVEDAGFSPIWQGRIDTIDNTHQHGDLRAIIKCTDDFAEFATNNTLEQSPVGAGETTSARVTRILDYYGWPEHRRDIATDGVNTVQATNFARDMLTNLQLTAEAEGGSLWMKPNGDVAFRAQDWESDTPDWLFGGLSGIPMRTVMPSWSLFDVINEAHFARTGGTEQVATDSTSILLLGRRTTRRLDLINDNDTDVLSLATRVVNELGTVVQYIQEASVLVQDDATVDFVLNVSIGDMIQITTDTMHGWSQTSLGNVIAISDEVTPEGWIMTIGLDDASKANEYGDYDRGAFSDAYHLGGQAP